MNKLIQSIQENKLLNSYKKALVSISGVQIGLGFVIFVFYQFTLYVGVDEATQVFLLRVFQTYCTVLGFVFSYMVSNALNSHKANALSIAVYSNLFCMPLLLNNLVVEFPIVVLLVTPLIHALYTRLIKLRINIKNAPDAVSQSLSQSLMHVIMISFVLVMVFIFDRFVLGLSQGVLWLCVLLTHPLAIIAIIIGINLVWIKGIHGMDVIGKLAGPFWFLMMLANMNAILSGQNVPFIGTNSFYEWAVFIGGSGSTIGLALLTRFFSKSVDMKVVGEEGFKSSLFNINEPIIFGVPVMDNAVFRLLFLIAPILSSLISYIAFSSSYVSVPVISAPWVLPAPIGIFIATLGDFRSIALVGVLILVSFIVYLPFFITYDRQLDNMSRH